MRAVYDAGSLVEAQLLVDLLADRGIRTHVRNTCLQGALGELPISVHPVVCVVDDRHYFLARDVAQQFEHARHADPGPDRACRGCGETSPGNFQVCWSCRVEFAEPPPSQPEDR